jgi:hypothetical protein
LPTGRPTEVASGASKSMMRSLAFANWMCIKPSTSNCHTS